MKRKSYAIKKDVVLINRVTNEIVTGDIINEDEIEGKFFFVIKSGNRVIKLAKDAYNIKRHA